MKNISLFAIPFALLFIAQTTLSAQKTATWKGGTPGRSTEWMCASNWREGRLPNEFSAVVIPDVSTGSQAYPVLRSGEVEVLSVDVQTGAMLTLSTGARLIADSWNCAGICRGCETRTLVEGTIKAPLIVSNK
ncbi:MAG TPA: hypothetical protein PLO67_15470 [Saprospiraceae bacterium]|nr:hypothetical protein [Saprospiraceae bacterium]HPI08438.1 hypothetical protein [Saprospiraceae bacterium]